MKLRSRRPLRSDFESGYEGAPDYADAVAIWQLAVLAQKAGVSVEAIRKALHSHWVADYVIERDAPK